MEIRDYTQLHKDIVRWVRSWFEQNGPTSPAIIGISGGKDSLITAAICAEALGPDRVVGVMLPDGLQSDISDSYETINFLSINSMKFNIGDVTDAFFENIGTTKNSISQKLVVSRPDNQTIVFPASKQAMQNLAPRIRMASLYFISQFMNGRVMNTCNFSEVMTGYFTLWGDGVGDCSPLGLLTCTEVINLGLEMGLPKHLVQKTPSDGLSHSSADEEKFGFTYAELDAYLRHTESALRIDPEHIALIRKWIQNSEFKRMATATFNPFEV